MNTDELSPEELQRLVDNNQELIEANEEEFSKEVQEEKLRLQKELMDELNKKNEIYIRITPYCKGTAGVKYRDKGRIISCK